MTDSFDNIDKIIEAAIFAAGEPLDVNRLLSLFPENQMPEKKDINAALDRIAELYNDRGVELKRVASGYRFQSRAEFAPYMQRLWERKPPRYSRALLETLALIVYKQPMTRGEIEEVRGVAVSTNIMKTLLDRGWIKAVGQKDVPGKPSLYGTTKEFLDYFNLSSLSELPPLQEMADLDELEKQLGMKLEKTDENEEENSEAGDVDAQEAETTINAELNETESESENDEGEFEDDIDVLDEIAALEETTVDDEAENLETDDVNHIEEPEQTAAVDAESISAPHAEEPEQDGEVNAESDTAAHAEEEKNAEVIA